MPRPGDSGTSIYPFCMTGLGRPVTRSFHQGTSTEWFSNDIKFSVAAAQWTLAIAAIGEPAMCIAMLTPYSCARSPIFLVSSIPPDDARSGWQTDMAPASNSFTNSSLQYMSSPVQMGVSQELASRTNWSVNCHGIMSSSQARRYLSRALERV